MVTFFQSVVPVSALEEVSLDDAKADKDDHDEGGQEMDDEENPFVVRREKVYFFLVQSPDLSRLVCQCYSDGSAEEQHIFFFSFSSVFRR